VAEMRIAFHNAVSRFQAWTADVAEPRVKLRGRFCPISEVCEAVSNLSHPLPRAILAILYKETHAGDGILAAKTDETYRGAGRRLLWLVEKPRFGGERRCASIASRAERSGRRCTSSLISVGRL
jgi:hypothetical protein